MLEYNQSNWRTVVLKNIALTIRRYVSIFIVCLFMLLPPLVAQQYDIVLQGGRVIDPESNL
jgi:hypothetical protein